MKERNLYRTNSRPKLLSFRGEKILHWVVVVMIITLAGVYISFCQAEALEYGYRYEELIEQTNKLKDEQRILHAELAFLKDPAHVVTEMSARKLIIVQEHHWVQQTRGDLNLRDEAALLE